MSCTTAWILSILSLTRSEITSRWERDLLNCLKTGLLWHSTEGLYNYNSCYCIYQRFWHINEANKSFSIVLIYKPCLHTAVDKIGFVRGRKCNNSYCACPKSHSDHWLDLYLATCFNLILPRFVNSQVAASYQMRFLTIFFHFIMFIHCQSGVSKLASKPVEHDFISSCLSTVKVECLNWLLSQWYTISFHYVYPL